MGVQGDGSRLNCNASILLVLASIRKSLFSSFGGGDDTCALDKGVGKGGFSVIDYQDKWSMNSRTKKCESVGSPWAITDIFRIFAGLSMSARILRTVSSPIIDLNYKA